MHWKHKPSMGTDQRCVKGFSKMGVAQKCWHDQIKKGIKVEIYNTDDDLSIHTYKFITFL